MKMIFHSCANETHFHKEDFALRLILKVRVFWHSKMAYQIPPHFFQKKKEKAMTSSALIRSQVNSPIFIS